MYAKRFQTLLILILVYYGSCSEISGGMWLGKSGNATVAKMNYNFTESIESFNLPYPPLYFMSYPEINYYFFSYQNETGYYQIARIYSDGTNFQTLIVMEFEPTPLSGCVQGKFDIDKANSYIYYPVGNGIFRCLLNGAQYERVITTTYAVVGVQFDSITNTIYFTSGYTINMGFGQMEQHYYFQGYSLSSQTYVVNQYLEGYFKDIVPCDFAVNNGKILLSIYDYNYPSYYYANWLQTSEAPDFSSTYSSYHPIPFTSDPSANRTSGVYLAKTSNIVYQLVVEPSGTLSQQATSLSDTSMYIYKEISNCPADCSLQGDCLKSNVYSCSCGVGYSGLSCSTLCTSALNCSSHGQCNSAGQCLCQENFYGAQCSTYCDSATTCYSHGNCSSQGVCICNSYYLGTNCETPIISAQCVPEFNVLATIDGVTKVNVSYNYNQQIFVIDYENYAVYYNFVLGLQYNVSATTGGCVVSPLTKTQLPPFQPTESFDLVYYAGNTAGTCVPGTASVWINRLKQQKLVMGDVCNGSAFSGAAPWYFDDPDAFSIQFDFPSYNFQPSSSLFQLPTSCTH
jgi:hypothetical protein